MKDETAKKMGATVICIVLAFILYLLGTGAIKYQNRKNANIPVMKAASETVVTYKRFKGGGSQKMKFPDGTSEVVNLGEDWFKFKLDGEWYLLRFGYRSAAMTKM